MSRLRAIVQKLYATEMKSDTRLARANGDRRRPDGKKRLAVFKKAFADRRMRVWVVWIIRIAVALGLIAEAVFHFNRLAASRTTVVARRADVERELKRRENLIPNLVAVVGKYASYEQEVFVEVAEVRETLRALEDSGISRTQAASELQRLLSNLVARAEEYPDLKMTQSLQDLMKEAGNTEDRIAEAKKEYNKAAEIYNQYRSVFPGNVFAVLYRFQRFPYIGLDEHAEVPEIDLDIATYDTVPASSVSEDSTPQ